MKNELYDWLEYQWKISNATKYQSYFDEWVINLTQNQIDGFYKNMTSVYYKL